MTRRPVAATCGVLLLLALTSGVRAQDPQALPGSVETGFDPTVDALPFFNAGNYASHGDCIGMSIVAIDRFNRRKAGETLAPGGTLDGVPEKMKGLVGDPVDHAHAALVQSRAKDVSVPSARPSDPTLIREALLRMKESGKPETLGLDGKESHCIVIFGYEGGDLLLYDPNCPGETLRWPFDPAKGLAKYPRSSAKTRADVRRFYPKVARIAALPLEKYPVSADLAKLRADAETQGEASAKLLAAVTASVSSASDGKVRIAGKVSRGLTRGDEGPTDPPTMVYLRVNGALQVAATKLAKDRSFSVETTLGPGENVIQVIAATDYGTFAGFTTVRVREPTGRRLGIIKALPD